MRRRAVAVLVAGVLWTVAALPAVAAAPASTTEPARGASDTVRGGGRATPSPRRAVPGSYLVQLQAGVEVDDLFAGDSGRTPAHRRYRDALNGFAAELPPGIVKRLAADPRVLSIEPDLLYTSSTTQTQTSWGLDRIDQRRRPLDGSYTYALRGRGVKVYILDSGVYAGHSDFGDRVVRGYDALGTGGTPDCQGHGTHVASTAAGRRWGVAKAARIVPVRVGCGALRLRDIVAGLDFVVRDHRSGTPAVVNMSLGGPASTAMDAAVRRVLDDRVTVVASAGNEGMNACRYSPARVPGVITVGATNRYDAIPEWSSFGTCIDLFAPGVGIRAAGRGSRDRSVVMSGTSMAAPHVTGVVARYLDAHPRATPATVSDALRSRTVSGLRGRYYGDPDRLLNIAGRTPTKLAQSASAGAVTFGQQVTVSGTLRNRLTGVPLAGRTVRLFHRRSGTSRWRQVAARQTSSTGRVRVTTLPTSPGDWQLRHPATLYGAASAAAASRVALRPAGTTLSRSASPLAVATGASTTLSGVLRNATTGAPVSGASVVVEHRVAGTTTWTRAGSASTSRTGRISFAHAPAATGDYRLRYAGSAWLFGKTTSPLGVTVLQPQSVDISLSSPAVVEGDLVQLSGTVANPGTGGTATIQEYDEYDGYGWYAIDTIAYGPDGTFVYNFIADWEGEYRYRVRVPPTETTAAAISNTAYLTVEWCWDMEWC